MEALTARIRGAGKKTTDDVMASVWVSGLLADGARRFLEAKSG